MPFLNQEFMQKQAVVIDQTSYENPEDPSDIINIYICKPSVQVLDKNSLDVNQQTLQALLNSYSQEALQKEVEDNKGILNVKVDGKLVSI